MIRTILFRAESRELVQGDVELLQHWSRQSGDLLWMDLADNDAASEAKLMCEAFGLHRLAIQDAQRARHQPKIEFFDHYDFLLLKGMGPDTDEFEFQTIQIGLFLGKNFLVTRHSSASPSIDRVWQSVLEDTTLLGEGPDAVMLEIARVLVERYTNRLMTLEPRLEDLEEQIVRKPKDDILAELMGYKTNLRQFRRVLLYHVGVFTELSHRSSSHVRADKLHHVKDVFEHQERAYSLATLYFEMATDLVDGYISLASHRLNNIMKVLTIITAIFVPLSFLAGIYGMNFEVIPELSWHYGYYALLGFMALLATSLLIVFRIKRWI